MRVAFSVRLNNILPIYRYPDMVRRSRSRARTKRARVSKKTMRRRGSRRSGSKKSRKSRKSKRSGKRKLNMFFTLMTNAKKKGLESFVYKGKKYVKKEKGGITYYKKA